MLIIKAFKKIKDILLAVFILLILILIMSRGKVFKPEELEYGVTFSAKQAVSLGLDWRAVYLAVLDDLKVKKLRLPAYWDEVEEVKGRYSWDDLDWQLDEAAARGAEVILTVGGRQPRWPECHFPAWAKKMSGVERERATLEYIGDVVKHYRGQAAIAAWQVENEPFLSSYFGECPKLNKDFLDNEIALVRSLDKRPIAVTDSGELSLWYGAASRADIFGTTMYRDTYSRLLGRYVHYPIGPAFFKFKRNTVGLLARPQKWLVIELQAEPWGPKAFQELSREERDLTMSPEKFKEMMEFARLTGFREFYLWGAEWWYWEKTTQNNPVFWEEAKLLFNR